VTERFVQVRCEGEVSGLSGIGRVVLVALVGGLAVAAGLGRSAAQFNGPVSPDANSQMRQPSPSRSTDDEPYVTREMQARQLKRLREEHQKQVFNDTAKLLQLATNLKAEVDKGSKPSPDVMRDVDEIGKLAKRVSDRIKTQ
jgi:hypothetical protein